MFVAVTEAKSGLKANKTLFEMFGSVGHVTSTVHSGSSSHGVLWKMVGNSFFSQEMFAEFSLPLHIYTDLSYFLRVSRHKNKEERQLSFNCLQCLFVSDQLCNHTHLNRNSSQTSVLILVLLISL